MRAAFLLQYKPKLLGDLAEAPKFENYSEDAVKSFKEQLEQRRKAAEEIPKELFDIELHILKKEDCSTIILEKNYDYIGGSASGDHKNVKQFDKLFREIYQYYGVLQKDIDNKTKRYE